MNIITPCTTRLFLTFSIACLTFSCGTPRQQSQLSKPQASSHGEKPSESDEAGKDNATSDALIRPPAAQPAVALPLPAMTESTLGNGLSVLLMPDKSIPLVSIQLHLRTGSIDEPEDKVGLAQFTFDMLRQGVSGMTADTLAERVDRAGISLSVSAGYELSSISCSGRATVLEQCVKLVAALVTKPTFPKKEMAEVRQQLLGAVRERRDNPSALASAHFENLLYGDNHPGGRPMTEATVNNITRKDLSSFKKSHLLPQHSLLAIAGAVDRQRTEKIIKKVFRSWKKRPATAKAPVHVKDVAAGFRVLLVDKPDLTQSFFAIGHQGIPFNHPDEDAIRIMNFVLGGGGFSSRMMIRVRSEGGKTYGITTQFSKNGSDGDFVISSFTRNDQLTATLSLVMQELKRIQDSPPKADEIAAAKGKIAGGYAIGYQRVAHLAAALARARLRGVDTSYVTEFPLRIDRLSQDRIAKAAKQHVKPKHLVGAIVGPAKKVASLLKKAGIDFTTISYLDPISAAARKKPAQNKPAQKSAVKKRKSR